ncbi:MAG: glycogen-debranching protein, partial [Polyangiaceae bacterium]|nr:glycogen-debranching protein [Polyangiaceae bacterium]
MRAMFASFSKRSGALGAVVLLTLGSLAACSSEVQEIDSEEGAIDTGGLGGVNGLGGEWSKDGKSVRFRVYSSRATRIEVHLFNAAFGENEYLSVPLVREARGTWTATVPASSLSEANRKGSIYYGYRAWGPNWTYTQAWTKGSSAGFVTDVDKDGNRFNPNKLLLDPYAIEMSHDPINPKHQDGTLFASGSKYRTADSGKAAPKGIVLRTPFGPVGTKPTRALKDEVIYEVHVRGLTKNDPSIPSDLRGTYAGAAKKAAYLKSLGVTAVEFLPLQETDNDNNSATSTGGSNYWGYMTLNYFSPDRRYAKDQTPGGPTREFQSMAKAFHDQGIKIYLDVVYNHTGEGGLWDQTGDVANVISFRGLDNPAYYELTGGNRFNYDNTGVGGNFNVATEPARNLIIDSLKYWKNVMGVDGFRFDLAAVLGNSCAKDCFNFDKMDSKNALNRAVRELPNRPEAGGQGVDLIAEPWAIGTYQVGNFPSGWAEWNGSFRDTFRKVQNKAGSEAVTPGQMAARVAGSSDLFQDDGRRPWHSVNFIVAHDGLTLRDLYSYNEKRNNQPWPFGPSDGGEDHNESWDQGGEPAMQRQAARTGMAMLMLSAGVPMITGGDEMYRTQYGNNNVYNLDSEKNWLDYSDATKQPKFFEFSKRLIAFRKAHPSLRPAQFFRGTDNNQNGLKDISWLRNDGNEADGSYMNNPSSPLLAYRVDASEGGEFIRSIYVAYNRGASSLRITLPASNGKSWYRAGDTAAWNEPNGSFSDAGK